MLQREVLSLSPLHHPDRVRACVDLSRSIHAQYQQTSNTLLLDEAIAIQREALSICSPDHPDCARACLDLSCSLGTRFKQTGDTLLLNEAITLQRQAFTLCPPGHPNHASLFQPFYTQFYETGDTMSVRFTCASFNADLSTYSTALRDEMPTQELVDQISEVAMSYTEHVLIADTSTDHALLAAYRRSLCAGGPNAETSVPCWRFRANFIATISSRVVQRRACLKVAFLGHLSWELRHTGCGRQSVAIARG
jgi:hypothetical protein